MNLVAWDKLSFLDSNSSHKCFVKTSIEMINSVKNGDSFNF